MWIIRTDQELRRWCRLIMKIRRAGGTIRQIARIVDTSKSTLHRWMPAIEAIAEEQDCSPDLSQMGQRTEPGPLPERISLSSLSQMGQKGER